MPDTRIHPAHCRCRACMPRRPGEPAIACSLKRAIIARVAVLFLALALLLGSTVGAALAALWP